MSGSLRIRGDIGKWTGTTALNNLAVTQAAMSVSGWIKITSISTLGSCNIFGMTLAPQSNAFGVYSNTNNTISYYVQGLSGGAGYSNAVTLDQWIHFAMTLDTSTAIVYINGLAKATQAGPGLTQNGPNTIFLGANGSPSVNCLLSQLAIWNGTKLSLPTVLDLRNGIVTPLTTPVPATSYWTCSGTAGANPTPADAGMHDQLSVNHFITMPGSGGSSSNAVYDADTPVFVPSITATGVVNRCSSLFTLAIGTNPDLGTRVPAYPTAVHTDPVFTLNGSQVDVIREWTSTGHTLPHIFYRPYSGTSPVVIAPTDVVVCATANNWVEAQQGLPKADSFTLNNCAGGYEPGDFGYMDFDPPPEQKTFKVGFGGSNALVANTAPYKNVFNRSQNPWTGAKTSTHDGIPLTFTSAGSVSTGIYASTPNGLDARQFPVPVGTWTYIADEALPATPLVAVLTGSDNSLITGPTITPGTIVGGVEVNRKWEWQLSFGAGTYNNALIFQLNAPSPHSNGQLVSHSRLRMFEPNDTIIDPIDPNLNVSDPYLRQCETDVPGVAVELLRYLSYAWPLADVARVTDLPLGTNFSQNPTANALATVWPVSDPTLTTQREIPIYAVRRYDLTQTPNVYVNSPMQNAVTSDNLSLAPYMIVPANNGLTYSWPFPSGTVEQPAGHNVICECVSGLPNGTPVLHNLVSGQFLAFDSFTFNVFNSLGTGVCTTGQNRVAWVTGPTTFACVQFSPGIPNSVETSQVTTLQVIPGGKVATAAYNMFGGASSFQSMAAASSASGNPAIWLCLNHCLDDPAVLQLAVDTRASAAVGTIVYLQISNEVFIPSDVKGVWDQLSSLQGFGYNTSEPAVVRRLGQMCTIFRNYWGADSASILSVYQPWTVDHTFNGLVYAQANNIEINRLALAEYIQISEDFRMMAASVVADYAPSIANPAHGGSGILCPMGALIDVWRYSLKYDKNWNGPGGYIAQHITARNGSGYTVFPMPKMIGYEISASQAIPSGVSQVDKTVRAGFSHDIMYYNPSSSSTGYYDATQAVCQHWSQPGPAGTEGYDAGCVVTLNAPRSFGDFVYQCTNGPDNSYVTLWCGKYAWQGQGQGLGLSNKFWAPTLGGDLLSHDWENVCPSSQSFDDWITGQAPPITGHFYVSPNHVSPSDAIPQGLLLTGVDTTWSGASVVSINNSITGTTTVTAGTFTAVSATLATLAVTTGTGLGTWTITIDGVTSPILLISSPRRNWFSGVRRIP